MSDEETLTAFEGIARTIRIEELESMVNGLRERLRLYEAVPIRLDDPVERLIKQNQLLVRRAERAEAQLHNANLKLEELKQPAHVIRDQLREQVREALLSFIEDL